MKTQPTWKISLFVAVLFSLPSFAYADPFRPPAVPLVTSDPYLSIWSEADRLTDKTTQHWTRRDNPLVSLIRIDGQSYRLMGNDPTAVPALPQMDVTVFPTRTVYDFGNAAVHVSMTFMTPLLPDHLEMFARPVTYITWAVSSVDGKKHNVAIYDSASAQIAVNEPSEQVTWKKETFGSLTALSAGAANQTLFQAAGDDTRINWGYAYLAAPSNEAKACIGGDDELLNSFITTGGTPDNVDANVRAANSDQPVLSFTLDLGSVGSEPVSRHVLVAYDEIYSIKWFDTKLRPYWRRNGATPADMLPAADADYAKAQFLCETFDHQLMTDMTFVGGERYASLASLAYRQAFAGCGLAADANKQPLLLTKENTSNGDLGTVDVFFPMDPLVIFLSPTLAKATVAPILEYAASPHWKFPNAPHDLGTYPVAQGRDDGGESMPVEESGNMLILCDAIAHDDGNVNFSLKYWPQLTSWAHFLEQYGLDPGDQLCTDDFMGHLAHNGNLSVKAIIALAAYGDLCRMRGDSANAAKYTALAKSDAFHWISASDAGDHSLLAFDKPGTWSQKYNLVWDRLLNLNVFPTTVAKNEVKYYKSQLLQYGVPLDSRTHLTKTDWSLWSATLADNKADFEAFVSPIYDYMDTTATRDPECDSYMTDQLTSGRFHARPVIGGLFIKMLDDRAIWKKWASMDTTKPGPWAPIPPMPKVTFIIPTSQVTPQTWRYTTVAPVNDAWESQTFDDSAWQVGTAGFGTTGTPNAIVNTTWKTDDIWIRRSVVLTDGDYSSAKLWVYHDDDVEIYINGVKAASEGGWDSRYKGMDIMPEAAVLLKPGAAITLAVHCHQRSGGQDIDVGLATVTYPTR